MKTVFFAHNYWKKILSKDNLVIDATVGNGHDTVVLAKLMQGSGKLYGYDIQKKALQNAQSLFLTALTEEEQSNIILLNESHETFALANAQLIVYNLGYLPGGDKSVTTQADTTVKSLISACKIVTGAISVMCYIGHEEGRKEFEKIYAFFQSLPSKDFLVCHHTWINRSKAPTFFWCEKIP